MVAIAASYRKGRSSVSSSVENFAPYQRPVWHPPLYDQHRSFRELSPKTQQYPPYRQRSNRQDIPPRPEQSPFRDQPYQDYPPHRYRPYYETDPSFKNVSHGPSSYFADGSSYHQERDQIPYTGKQPSYQDDRQFFRDDYRFPNQYDKPINYYKEQSGQQQVESFGRDPEYLKHGKHLESRETLLSSFVERFSLAPFKQINRYSFNTPRLDYNFLQLTPFSRFFKNKFSNFFNLEKDTWIFK